MNSEHKSAVPRAICGQCTAQDSAKEDRAGQEESRNAPADDELLVLRRPLPKLQPYVNREDRA